MAAMKWIRRAALILLLLLCAYVLAGLIGGAVPVNRGWRETREPGVRIYLEDNGVHTDLVLPVAAAGVDWRDLVRPEHVRDPRFGAYRHLAFGWGDRDFYMRTPTWWDVNPLLVARAAIGGKASVMHISWEPEPQRGRAVRSITLRPEEYRRLTAFVRASFADDPGHAHGYFGNDVFYTAKGHYSAYGTCNEWTGAALRAAGLRMGAWTPFAVSVMQWF